MPATPVKYFRVPSTGQIFLHADDLILWTESAKARYPELGKLAEEFEGMIRNLKRSADKHHEEHAAKAEIKTDGHG